MFFQSKIFIKGTRKAFGIREGGRWPERDFGVSACGLFVGLRFRSSFLCIRRRCLLHFIIFREETILEVAGSDRRTDRLIRARPRVN